MRLPTFVSLVLVASGLPAACSSPSDDGGEEENLEISRLEGFFPATSSSIQEPREVVIRSQEEWNAFWEAHQPGSARPAPPPVDFEEHMVVAVALGERPTGGFSVRIEEVEREGSVLEIEAVETAPGEGCAVTMALTYPVDAVVVPRAEGEVELELEREVRGC